MSANIYITDYDDHEAPPGQQVLEVGVVGDAIFLAIGHWEESPDERHFVTAPEKQISVDIGALANAVLTARAADA